MYVFFVIVLKCATMALLNSLCGFVRVVLFTFDCAGCVKMGKRQVGNW